MACELALVVGMSAAAPRAKIEVRLVVDEASCLAAEPAQHRVQMSRYGATVVLGAVADAGAADCFDAVVGYVVALKTYFQPRSHPVYGWT